MADKNRPPSKIIFYSFPLFNYDTDLIPFYTLSLNKSAVLGILFPWTWFLCMYMLINTILFHCLIFPLIISWINYNINLANNTSLVGTFSTSCTTDNKSSNNLVTLEMQLQLHLPKKKKKKSTFNLQNQLNQSVYITRQVCSPQLSYGRRQAWK